MSIGKKPTDSTARPYFLGNQHHENLYSDSFQDRSIVIRHDKCLLTEIFVSNSAFAWEYTPDTLSGQFQNLSAASDVTKPIFCSKVIERAAALLLCSTRKQNGHGAN